MEFLINFDKELFIFLNSFHSPLWDYFFWFFSGTVVWIPLYASVLYVVIKQTGIKSIWIIIAIALTITICDQIASGFFKPFFERLRPSHEPELVNSIYLLNGFKAGKFGFISSHAANSFGLATLIGLIFKRKWVVLFFLVWALINSYSRIYLGLHYPGDILVGALVGVASGWLTYKLYLCFVSRFVSHKGNLIALQQSSTPSLVITLTGWLSIFIMFLSAWQLMKII